MSVNLKCFADALDPRTRCRDSSCGKHFQRVKERCRAANCHQLARRLEFQVKYVCMAFFNIYVEKCLCGDSDRATTRKQGRKRLGQEEDFCSSCQISFHYSLYCRGSSTLWLRSYEWVHSIDSSVPVVVRLGGAGGTGRAAWIQSL